MLPALVAGIADIDDGLARPYIQNDGGHVEHLVGGEDFGMPAYHGLGALLHRVVDGAFKHPVTLLFAQGLQIVVGNLREGPGLFGERLVLGQFAFERIDRSFLAEFVEQEIAFGQEGVAAAAGMDQGGGVGQDGQHRGVRPREFVGRPAEIAPGSRLQSHDVAAERRMGRIER